MPQSMPPQKASTAKKTTPGFLDSIVILLVSAALVCFLLWAASRTIGINAFESLPPWLEGSYHAVWASVASGATGIGLAIVKAFTRKADEVPINYLAYILTVTVLFLILISVIPILFKHRLSEQVTNNSSSPTTPSSAGKTQTVQPLDRKIKATFFEGILKPAPPAGTAVRVIIEGAPFVSSVDSIGRFRVRVNKNVGDLVNVTVCFDRNRVFNDQKAVTESEVEIDVHSSDQYCE